MKYHRILIIATLLALAACQPKGTGAGAVAGTADKAPLATVNGAPVDHDLFEVYVKSATNGKGSADLTAEQRQQALDNLVRATVVSAQAAKDGLDKDKDTAALLELARLNVLQQAVSAHYLKDKKPTEQELRAEYETQVAAMPRTEYHARHILVATDAFAQKLIDQLDKGGNFADLAKRESMDSSKSSGGDLGWFTPDSMVKAFAEAVVALKPGDYTHKPIQTQYGWHVIKLEETRDLAAPPFDTVRQRLEQVVQARKFKSYVDDLMKGAKVEKKT